jgi:hypothetical protein
MFAANALETRDDWTVYAPDSDVRTAVLRRIRRDSAEQAAQIRFTVVDPEQTKVANYLHAFAYAESRRASVGNVKMLNELPMQLGIPIQQAEDTIQEVFAARPVCPLGGQYVVAGPPATARWENTALSRESSDAANRVPDEYRFPFLAWFRGAHVRFLLGQETLQADIVLRVGSDDHDSRKGVDHPLGEESTVADTILRPILPGDRVGVGVEGAELRVGDQVLGSLPRGTSLSVLEVRGSWIGVETESRASRLRGWVRRRDLRKQ